MTNQLKQTMRLGQLCKEISAKEADFTKKLILTINSANTDTPFLDKKDNFVKAVVMCTEKAIELDCADDLKLNGAITTEDFNPNATFEFFEGLYK